MPPKSCHFDKVQDCFAISHIMAIVEIPFEWE